MSEFRKRTKAKETERAISGADITSFAEQRLRAIDACAAILARAQLKPVHLDGDPRLRATWWVDYMIEPPSYPSERPMRTPFGKNDKGETQAGLIEPYINRVTHCLGKYFRFAEEDQRYIVAAREDNIRWRGDAMEFFRRVAETTLVWRELDDEGKAAFKAETARKAMAVVREMVALRPSPALATSPPSAPASSKRCIASPEQRAEYDRGAA